MPDALRSHPSTHDSNSAQACEEITSDWQKSATFTHDSTSKEIALPWRRATIATLCGGITATVTPDAGRWAARVDYPGGFAVTQRDTEAEAMAAAEAIVRERLA